MANLVFNFDTNEPDLTLTTQKGVGTRVPEGMAHQGYRKVAFTAGASVQKCDTISALKGDPLQ